MKLLEAIFYPEEHDIKVGSKSITPHDILCPVCGTKMAISSLQTEPLQVEDVPAFTRFSAKGEEHYAMHQLNLQHQVKMVCEHCPSVELSLTFNESNTKLVVCRPHPHN